MNVWCRYERFSWVVRGAFVLSLVACRTDGDAKTQDASMTPEVPAGDPGAPKAPTKLYALAASQTTIELAWTDNASDEMGFVIERASFDQSNWASVGQTASDTAAFVDKDLQPAQTFRYRVLARNAKGLSASSNVATATTQSAVPDMLSIPTAHPRLFFTPERLAAAKAWYKNNPFEPAADNKEEIAFKYLMTGDKALARQAIDWLKSFELDVSRSVSDDARWSGERAILIFDWCYDEMTEDERKMLVARWNTYVDTLNKKDWGNTTMPGPANNYFWGYFRNGIEWPIASWHENPQAPALLDHAMKVRWEGFKKYGEAGGAGGVPAEGSQYGRYMLGYAVVPLTSARLYGRNMWEETQLFKSSVFYMAYSLTPDVTLLKGGSRSSYETFPYADDDNFRSGGTASSLYAGSFLGMAVDTWKSVPVGGYAQQYLDVVKPPIPPYVAAVMPKVAARSFADLPLDYYAPGIGFFYVRNAWKKEAMLANLQLGFAQGADHRHLDAGSFLIWRGGRWLSRETTGYHESCKMPGWKGEGTFQCPATVLHNSVLFEGYGLANAYHKGIPKTLRLESRDTHSFAAVDLSDVYLSTSDRVERDHNPYAEQVIREFLFVRPLETLVVFDRMKANSTKKPAAEVTKTFLLHFEEKPTIKGNSAEVTLGSQVFRATTLVPKNATSRVIDEGGKLGQFRWEVDAVGADPGYLLHVLVGKDAGSADVTASVEESSDAYELTLSHPQKGQAKLVISKGMASTGGQFGYAASGAPMLKALPTGVQKSVMTDDGPVWR